MDFLLPVKNRIYVFKGVTCLITVICFVNILQNNQLETEKEAFLILCLLIYVANNTIRRKLRKEQRNFWFILSYGCSVLILGYLSTQISFIGTDVFNILLLMELIVFAGKLNIPLILFNFFIFVASNSAYCIINDFILGSSEIANVLLNFFSPCLILFLFRSVVAEKTKYEQLNRELKIANVNLNEYAKKVEELSKTRERNRIAQEIHDSIGHSLMALKMNLEYAENILEVNPDKTKEVICKSQSLTKNCVKNLRKVVSLSNDTRLTGQLREAIQELFLNFKETNRIKFYLEMENCIEREDPDIKNCIYKIVREAITNGVKHGNASIFNIEISNESDKINLLIRNNGFVPECFIKSNGVFGMEERVKALGGSILFMTQREKGFAIEAVIPKS
ncbi:MAG: sensor histidine kinase [Velocimicrobium sp.]